jgi:homoserine kinase
LRFRLKVPATSANLGPGFDSLGLALELWNEVELEVLPGFGKPIIDIDGEGAGALPFDENHMIYRVLSDYCQQHGFSLPRLRLNFLNRLPLARGLGSSASARVMGVALGQLLVAGKLDSQELIEIATRLEGHPDNVAPAVVGGLVASLAAESGVITCPRPLHPDWRLIVCVPEFQLETHLSRLALPPQISHADAVFNVTRLPILLAALEQGRADWLREASRDVLHQPYRVALVPGLREVFRGAIDAGAAAVYLSGAGPSVAAWVQGPVQAVAAAMEREFSAAGIASRSLSLGVAVRGAHAQSLG